MPADCCNGRMQAYALKVSTKSRKTRKTETRFMSSMLCLSAISVNLGFVRLTENTS